jgi:hypothetical protein
MRTTQRDQGATVRMSAFVVDAASGAGVFQPGNVPFAMVRQSAGSYYLNFDPRVTPRAVNIQCTAQNNVGIGTRLYSTQGGQIVYNTYNAAGALASEGTQVSFDALDKRL